MEKIKVWKSAWALSLAALLPFGALQAQKAPSYPKTRKTDVSDNYHGTKVSDPYRWLEKDTDPEVTKWVEEENKVTQGYLSQIPYRDAVRKRLAEIWNYARYSAPFRKGGKYYYYKNDGLQNQSVLYVTEDPAQEGKVFLDPNKLSNDGTVALSSIQFNREGNKMGYIINRSGSDWQEIYVLDVNTGKRTADSIRWAKFSGISWQGDGFFYSRYDEPKAGTTGLSEQNDRQKVFYHKLGDPQSKDVLIYEDATRPMMGFSAGTSHDESMIFIVGHEGASGGNELYYRQVNSPEAGYKKIFTGTDYSYDVVDNIGDKVLVITNKNASRYQLILVDPENPSEKNWKVIIPEHSKNVLQSVSMAGGKLFAIYMQDASKHVYQYSLSGKLERKVELPGLGTASGFDGDPGDQEVYYSFTSFTYPATVFKYNIASGKSEPFRKGEVKFNPADYESKQVFVKSKDGTEVPVFIVHKKGLKLNGKNPTYLYGYGGFNISMNPGFTVSRLVLLENGGVFAMACMRGGGEYGESWHKGGMRNKKQNVFDDFIAAAEYLVSNGYTSKEKLAIAGGSNGGLLVGACMTQRPDLFKVAFPAVGVLDMLRFHKFTIGHAWVPEYGTSDSADHFKYLYAYSPLHNLKKGTQYPATMVTTADHDDRVVPAHSFKFAAALQEVQSGKNPVLIRIETKAGHGAGKPTAKQIDEWADIWSFMFYNMGVKPVYTAK